MTTYLIYPTEQEALARSHDAHVSDTVTKMRKTGVNERAARNAMAEFVTQYRWATDVGADGQTALVIDGDEELLTAEEIAASVPELPDGEGENWYKPPPEMPSAAPTEPPINEDVPHAYQEGGLLICTMGNWVDPPPDTYDFQWQVDGIELGGATTDELPVTLDDEGKTFACVVTATNAIGSTWIASNDVTVDAAALPEEIRYFQALKRRKASLTAKDSLLGFAKAMHPDPEHPDDVDFSLYKPALHHEVIAAALEEVEAGRLRRLIINCPPRHGKSELASRLFPPWFLGKHPRDSIISASYNEKFSWDFGREVKNTIEDPVFRQIFPEIAIATASVDRIEVETGGKVFFTGRGGSITGRGAIGLILDDPIKDRTEADSPTVREKVWKWYTQVMRSRLVTSKGWIIIIQCMTGDTPVMLGDGKERPLRDIRPGDRVASYDRKTKRLVTETVLNWANQGPDSVFTIKTKSGSVVKANARHPFLVATDGEPEWRRTDTLRKGDKILRVTGVSGAGRSARRMDANFPLNVRDFACPTTTRTAGSVGSARLQSIIARSGERISNIATASLRAITTLFSRLKAEFALFAKLLPAPSPLGIGPAPFASTIIPQPAKFADFSAIPVIGWSASPKPQMNSPLPQHTYEIIPDPIVEISETGVEEVFDIQVSRTENFIAHNLCCSNTRWHEDDLVGRLTDKTNPSYVLTEAKKWSIIDLPAIARDNDPIGRKVGEALWPERFPVEHLEDLREGDPRGFQALYQGSPTPEKGNFFPGDCIMTYSKAEMPPKEELRFYAASDHAVSTAQDRDKTCLMIIGLDKDTNIWIMPELIWGRFTTDYTVERMIDLMAKFKPQYWWAEKGHISKSIGPFLRKRMLERSTFCSVIEVTPTHDKKTRAQSISSRMAMRMVYFPSFAPWWADARDELLKFPFGTHDDFCDTLAWVGMGLGIHVPAKRPKPIEKGPKQGTLGWIKASAEAELKPRRTMGGW